MSKRTIEEIRADIEKINDEIEEIECDIECLYRDLESKEYDKEFAEQKQERLFDELYREYPLLVLTDETRPDIGGQYTRNGKWYLCNGYALLESNKKFEEINETKGIETKIEDLITNREYTELDIEYLNEPKTQRASCYECYNFKNFLFQTRYVDAVINTMGKENIKDICIYKNDDKFGLSGVLYIKGKNMRAVILACRNAEV